jgi:hypothetical protein
MGDLAGQSIRLKVERIQDQTGAAGFNADDSLLDHPS